jgi:alkyl hydroperoxide reductase subunit AhpC
VVPYCNAQLRAFQRSLDRFADIGIVMAALSVDDEATTKNLIAKHGLQFPIGHSADARAIAAATGAFVNGNPVYLQSTGFILDPSGRVVISVYSSGAIGRLVPDDVIGLVRYLREHDHASPHQRRPRLSAPCNHWSTCATIPGSPSTCWPQGTGPRHRPVRRRRRRTWTG